jgi:hypothetical protein
MTTASYLVLGLVEVQTRIIGPGRPDYSSSLCPSFANTRVRPTSLWDEGEDHIPSRRSVPWVRLASGQPCPAAGQSGQE